jgi:hypothetical protein
MAALHGINGARLICDATTESYYAAETRAGGAASLAEAPNALATEGCSPFGH